MLSFGDEMRGSRSEGGIDGYRLRLDSGKFVSRGVSSVSKLNLGSFLSVSTEDAKPPLVLICDACLNVLICGRVVWKRVCEVLCSTGCERRVSCAFCCVDIFDSIIAFGVLSQSCRNDSPSWLSVILLW